jgi:hypothetical protein
VREREKEQIRLNRPKIEKRQQLYIDKQTMKEREREEREREEREREARLDRMRDIVRILIESKIERDRERMGGETESSLNRKWMTYMDNLSIFGERETNKETERELGKNGEIGERERETDDRERMDKDSLDKEAGFPKKFESGSPKKFPNLDFPKMYSQIDWLDRRVRADLNPLYASNHFLKSYSNQTLMEDQKFKLSTMLYEKGVRIKDNLYAKTILSQTESTGTTRKDAISHFKLG